MDIPVPMGLHFVSIGGDKILVKVGLVTIPPVRRKDCRKAVRVAH